MRLFECTARFNLTFITIGKSITASRWHSCTQRREASRTGTLTEHGAEDSLWTLALSSEPTMGVLAGAIHTHSEICSCLTLHHFFHLIHGKTYRNIRQLSQGYCFAGRWCCLLTSLLSDIYKRTWSPALQTADSRGATKGWKHTFPPACSKFNAWCTAVANTHDDSSI